jgi:hypothetical protein
MIVTAWNNGSHHQSGAGYGVKLDAKDRDQFFQLEWKTINLELEGSQELVEVNIDKKSFWGDTCRELINIEIGRWLIDHKLAPWPKNNPPKLRLQHVSDNHFLLTNDKVVNYES